MLFTLGNLDGVGHDSVDTRHHSNARNANIEICLPFPPLNPAFQLAHILFKSNALVQLLLHETVMVFITSSGLILFYPYIRFTLIIKFM